MVDWMLESFFVFAGCAWSLLSFASSSSGSVEVGPVKTMAVLSGDQNGMPAPNGRSVRAMLSPPEVERSRICGFFSSFTARKAR